MTILINEGKPHEIRDGARLVLSFHHDGQQYVTDRGEPLGRDWNEARRRAEDLAAKRRSR